jgi:hypothetical protein
VLAAKRYAFIKRASSDVLLAEGRQVSQCATRFYGSSQAFHEASRIEFGLVGVHRPGGWCVAYAGDFTVSYFLGFLQLSLVEIEREKWSNRFW